MMNFKNFIPPAGKDSTKIDTVLKKGSPIVKTYNLDGYNFINPAGKDVALSKMSLDVSATMQAQTAKIPLDGSNMGAVSLDVTLNKLHFEA
jgi:hypothetical protein